MREKSRKYYQANKENIQKRAKERRDKIYGKSNNIYGDNIYGRQFNLLNPKYRINPDYRPDHPNPFPPGTGPPTDYVECNATLYDDKHFYEEEKEQLEEEARKKKEEEEKLKRWNAAGPDLFGEKEAKRLRIKLIEY